VTGVFGGVLTIVSDGVVSCICRVGAGLSDNTDCEREPLSWPTTACLAE